MRLGHLRGKIRTEEGSCQVREALLRRRICSAFSLPPFRANSRERNEPPEHRRPCSTSAASSRSTTAWSASSRRSRRSLTPGSCAPASMYDRQCSKSSMSGSGAELWLESRRQTGCRSCRRALPSRSQELQTRTAPARSNACDAQKPN